jgi:hypothetical protein
MTLPIDHLVQPFGPLTRRGRCRRLCGPQSQGQADQVLLNAVVQVPLNAAAGRIGGADDPRAGDDELRLCLGVGDRVPTISVNAASLASTFRGSRPLRAPAIMTPHRWSSTLMGAPTKERILAADPAADTGAVPLP